MRIALVIWSLGPGGAERTAVTLANEWHKSNDVSVFTVEGPSQDHYELANGITRNTYRRRHLRLSDPGTVTSTRSTSSAWLVLGRLGAFVRELRVAWQLRRFLRSNSPDVIVSFMTGMNNRTLIAVIGLEIPVIVREEIDPRHHPESNVAHWLRKLLYRRASALVVMTESVREWALSFIDPARVAVIPNPISVRSVVAKTEDLRLVLGVGRFVHQKGFDVLIQAFARSIERRPEWMLQIAGDGPENVNLQVLASDLGIQDRVEFPGIVKNVDRLYSEAAIFVLSSRSEGFGNVLVEAMQHGVACISTDCPSGPSEILTNGKDGLLVPVDDVDAMAKALGCLMDDPDRRRELGCHASVSGRRFTLDKVSKTWHELLESVRSSYG